MHQNHKITTEDRYSRIDEIKEGDKVWAYNVETGDLELKEVLKVYVKQNDEILHLEVDDGDSGYGFEDTDRELETIDTTTNHPFYVPSKGWVAAGDLTIGDEVFTLNGKHAIITGMELETLDEAILVYNIEVEDFHTYFVGDGEASVLVHNSCGDIDEENWFDNLDDYDNAGGGYKAGDTTPNGKAFSSHAADQANERGITGEQIDRFISQFKNSSFINELKQQISYVDKKTGNQIIVSFKDVIVTMFGNTNGGYFK